MRHIIDDPMGGDEVYIAISQTEWEKITNRLDLLDALKAGGVDNWEGYSAALEEWNDDA